MFEIEIIKGYWIVPYKGAERGRWYRSSPRLKWQFNRENGYWRLDFFGFVVIRRNDESRIAFADTRKLWRQF